MGRDNMTVSGSIFANSFRIGRGSPELRQRHNDARLQAREREIRLREKEDLRIESLRGLMSAAVSDNASMREFLTQSRDSIETLSRNIRDLRGQLNEPGANEASIREQLRYYATELFALKDGLSGLESTLGQSDENMAEQLAKLQALIDAIMQARDERDHLNISVELQRKKLEQEEIQQEREEIAEERRANREGDTPRETPRAFSVAMMGARMDGIDMMSLARDKLSKEAMNTQPTDELDRRGLNRVETLQDKVSRMNTAIAKNIEDMYSNSQALQELQLLREDDDDEFVVNIRL